MAVSKERSRALNEDFPGPDAEVWPPVPELNVLLLFTDDMV